MIFRSMIPMTTRYNIKSISIFYYLNVSISLNSILHLSNFAPILFELKKTYSGYKVPTLCKCYCSFVLLSDFRALILWMLSFLFE